MTRDLFDRHLSGKPFRHQFAENADALIKQLREFTPPPHVREHTYGFVTPTIDNATKRELLSLLSKEKWTAISINHDARMWLDDRAIPYVHITMTMRPH